MPGLIQELTDQLKSLSNEIADGHVLSPAQRQRLKREYGERIAQQLVTAAVLQRKAREKLGDGTWWVTDKSLQQATPWQVARAKAVWFGDRAVYDLCCGIGGDTLQLARRGSVVGVDFDASLIAMSAANAQTAGVRCEFVCTDATRYELADGAAIHLDPDRRRDGKRSSQPERYQPAWDEVLKLIDRANGALVKLAPAADVNVAGIDATHRVWISLAGSVREQTLVCGDLAATLTDTTSCRSAIVMDRSGSADQYLPKVDLAGHAAQASQPGEWMIEPDAAIRAAGLTEAFAREYGLSTLGGPAGFLTCKQVSTIPEQLAVIEPVIWIGSSDDRKLRREFRARNVYAQRIKTRGVDVDPAKLQKRLRDCGDQPVSLWIGRLGHRQYAAITGHQPSCR